jgi:hypothetical protein
MSVNLLSPSCFPHLGSAPHRAAAPRPRMRGTGHFPPSGRPARRGTGARSHASRIRPGRGNTSFTPRHTHLCNLACAKGGSGAASAAQAVKAGAAWGFRLVVCGARVQKRGRRQRPRRPSYQPHWGFPFPLLLRERREREEEGGTAAAPGRGGTRPHRNTDDMPTEEHATAASHRERKESGTRSRERGAGSTDRS